MEISREKKVVTHFLSAFFSLPAAVVAIMVCKGPSSVDGFHPAWLDAFLVPVFVAVVGLSFAAFTYVFSSKKFSRFLIRTIVLASLLIFLSAFAGIHVHRDFFTATFQYILCVPAILVVYVLRNDSRQLQKNVLQAVSVAGYVLAAFYTEWIMLMGYAIATRAEPRPIESVVYNVYNLILVFILFFASRAVKKSSFTLVKTGSDSLVVNGRDITSVAGQKKTMLVHALASSRDRRIRCPEIQRMLHPDAADMKSDCATCPDESRKAAMCSQYRTTYNSILETKKLLEFLGVGTITASDNRRNVLQEGWTMVLFENVRIEIKK